jgi:hypothetical protein
MSFADSGLGKSANVVRIVGYVLFTLSTLNTLSLFFPPAFMNPAWELQVMGRLVDAVPVPLISLAMIFFGEGTDRLRVEKLPLRFLSWACLGFAIIHFALLPLGLGNTWRVNNRNNSQIGTALSQQITPLQAAESKLNQSNSEVELQKIITDLVRVNPNQAPNLTNPKVIRDKMLTEISKTTQKLKANSDAAKLATLQNLIRASAKLNLGTIASAIAYFFLWKLTPWARVGGRRSNRKTEPVETKPETPKV